MYRVHDGRNLDATDWRNVTSLIIRVILSDAGAVNNTIVPSTPQKSLRARTYRA